MTGEAQRSPFLQDIVFVVMGWPLLFRGDVWFSIALLLFLASGESIRFAVHIQDVDVMGELLNRFEPRILAQSSSSKFAVTSVALCA